MGIIQKLTYSIKRLNDINAELEANRDNLKKGLLLKMSVEKELMITFIRLGEVLLLG